MSKEIKRYAIFVSSGGFPYLGQVKDGAAVMFNDYDKLAQANAELVEALQFIAAYPMGGTAVGRVARAALAKYKGELNE